MVRRGRVVLAGSTTYTLTVTHSSTNKCDFKIDSTDSDAEDSASQAGWSIADTHFVESHFSTGSSSGFNNTTSPAALRIRVNGEAIVPRVERVWFSSTPAAGTTYGREELMEVSVEFSRAVVVTGTPKVTSIPYPAIPQHCGNEAGMSPQVAPVSPGD